MNRDGVTNQVEGGVIQAMSWATKDQVTFDRQIVTSHDWVSYPILTFHEIPEIKMTVINCPDQPSKGVREPVTVAAAIDNAIFDATGARVRELPTTPEHVQQALETPVATPVSGTPAATPVSSPES